MIRAADGIYGPQATTYLSLGKREAHDRPHYTFGKRRRRQHQAGRRAQAQHQAATRRRDFLDMAGSVACRPAGGFAAGARLDARSEERRGGKEWVSTFRYRWWPEQKKKKTK